jgi:hypothetical protein
MVGATIRNIDQGEYSVGSTADVCTTGLGPCVGILVGYAGTVSLLHAPMPDAGGAEEFFAELCAAIPIADRAQVRPVLAGGLSTAGRPVPASLARTRRWVEMELHSLGFGPPHVHWGAGGPLACHNIATAIARGHAVITHHELLGDPATVAVVPLW